jgi:hypothetical protein
MLRFTLAAIALSRRRLQGHDDHDDHAHDHDDEEIPDLPVCGCLAQDMGFTIDCSDQDAMQAAYDAVVACTGCSSTECRKNFAIVEAHHDFCLHDEVPHDVEIGFHALENKCEHQCMVGRKTDGLVVCEEVHCDEPEDLTAAYEALMAADCATTCTESCGANYRTLRAFHDACPADAMSQAQEEYLHVLEEPCEEHDCWVRSSHCPATVDATDLAVLTEAAFDRCSFTLSDAKACPAANDDGDDSAAFAAALVSLMLWH